MDERLQRLLDSVWEHDLPLGPYGDIGYRERAESEWEASLTADDCLALLGWVERPEFPKHWEPVRERWLPGLVDRAASHVGRAGRRLGDTRITRHLVGLLAVPNCRPAALEGLAALADPAAFDGLLSCLGERQTRLGVCVAIAASATAAQAEQLRGIAATDSSPELREAAAEVLAEIEAVRRDQQAEPGAAADGGRDSAS